MELESDANKLFLNTQLSFFADKEMDFVMIFTANIEMETFSRLDEG